MKPAAMMLDQQGISILEDSLMRDKHDQSIDALITIRYDTLCKRTTQDPRVGWFLSSCRVMHASMMINPRGGNLLWCLD